MKKLVLSFLLLMGYQLDAAESHALQTDRQPQSIKAEILEMLEYINNSKTSKGEILVFLEFLSLSEVVDLYLANTSSILDDILLEKINEKLMEKNSSTLESITAGKSENLEYIKNPETLEGEILIFLECLSLSEVVNLYLENNSSILDDMLLEKINEKLSEENIPTIHERVLKLINMSKNLRASTSNHPLDTDHQAQQTMQNFIDQKVGITLNQNETVTLRFVQSGIIIIVPAPLVEQCELLKDIRELFKDNYEEDIQKFTLTPEGVQLLVKLSEEKLTIVDKKIQEPLSLDEFVDLFMAVTTLGYKHPDSEIDIIKILEERIKELFLTAVNNNHMIDSATLEKIQVTLLRNPLIEALVTRGWSIFNTLEGHTNDVISAAFNRDGSLLATVSLDGAAKLWNPQTGLCVLTLRNPIAPIFSVAFSPDGKSIAIGLGHGVVRILGINDEYTLTLTGHTSEVVSVAFSPDGKSLATDSLDMTVKLWEVATGKCIRTLEGHTNRVSSAPFSPDGALLVTGSLDHTAKLWEVATGKCIRTLEGHIGRVSAVFSPDGRFIVTASRDKTAKIWDARTGECTATLKGHTDCVYSVTFSPDGEFLITASRDKTVKIWEVKTGKCFQTLEDHTDEVNFALFSDNGQSLATASADRTAKLWINRFRRAGINNLKHALQLSIQDALFIFKTGEQPEFFDKIPAAKPAKAVQEEDSYAPAGPADPVKPVVKKSASGKHFFSGSNDDDDADED